MATVPANLAEFSDLVSEDIQKIFIKRMEEKGMEVDKYMNVSDTTSYYDKDSSVLGTERAKYISENASVVYDAPIQGFDQTYTQKKYGDGMKLTDQVWKYGIDFRKITSITETLMDAMTTKCNTDGADMLNEGFGTSYTDDDAQTVSTAGGDTVAYFSASHTREDGGTNWNNIVYDGTTYNMDFEYDALKAARKTAAAVLTGRGQKMMVEPDTLVCKYGSSVHDRYEELMGAISRNYIPGGDENDGAAKVGLPKLITSKYLDNDLYWFAFDSGMLNEKYGLQWRWSQRPSMDAPKLEYDSDEYRRKATMFYDRGANDMRTYFGSTGANA